MLFSRFHHFQWQHHEHFGEVSDVSLSLPAEKSEMGWIFHSREPLQDLVVFLKKHNLSSQQHFLHIFLHVCKEPLGKRKDVPPQQYPSESQDQN